MGIGITNDNNGVLGPGAGSDKLDSSYPISTHPGMGLKTHNMNDVGGTQILNAQIMKLMEIMKLKPEHSKATGNY